MAQVVRSKQGFANCLKGCRISSGYTQEELSKICGIATSTLAHYEAADRYPDFENFCKLVYALDCSPVYLMVENA